MEVVPGIYEEWNGSNLAMIDVLNEVSLDGLSIPFGTCTLVVNNKSGRFNPFNRAGLFLSIEEGQPVPIQYGVVLPNKMTEYLPVGTYFQRAGGWQTDAYGLTITFNLVDIIGMYAARDFVPPTPLPTNCAGWIAAVMAHLGEKFANRYIVDPSIAAVPVTALLANVSNRSCGDIFRFVGMAVGAFVRADAATGDVRMEPLPQEGGVSIGLNNMKSYPVNKAGRRIAQINFTFGNSAKTKYTVNGTLESTDTSLNVSNPFITTQAQADRAADAIFRYHGGVTLTVHGRGDMRSEPGDLDSIATGFGETALSRRFKHQLRIDDGILKTAPSYLILEEDPL